MAAILVLVLGLNSGVPGHSVTDAMVTNLHIETKKTIDWPILLGVGHGQ